MNDLPWFNGTAYVSLDGTQFPDYNAAAANNVSLVSNAYSAFYNPDSPVYNGSFDVNNTPAIQDSPSVVLNNGSAGPVDTSGGWGWLTPILGGVVTTAGSIAATKIDTQIKLANIEAQGKLGLAQQAQAQQLLAAQAKYNLNATPVSAPLSGGQWLALIAALAGIGFAITR